MKLATFELDGGTLRVGLADPEKGLMTDVTSALPDIPAFSSMQSLIEAGPAAMDRLRRFDANGETAHQHLLDTITLLAPVPRPIQMRDAMTFPLHIRQGLRGLKALSAVTAEEGERILASELPPLPDIYKAAPMWYFTNHLAVGGPGTETVWPSYSKRRDFELELGIFTWQTASDISEGEAPDHIFGYTIFNDFSARDQQSIEMPGMLGPGKGKSFDNSNIIGPWIVTPDELTSPYELKTCAVVDGERWAEGITSGMLYSFEELIASLSRSETLHAGEFIGSGTVENGCGLEMNRYLDLGARLQLEIEGIGALHCSVAS